jgi:hypothetical protein
MEVLIVLMVMAAFAWCAYKNGKRIGSRKGYNVGRYRRRKHRRR